MLWVTRQHVHVDRVACPWLIKRFVDKEAQFIFLPREQITEFVNKTGAIPFDTGTGVKLDHLEKERERWCTFDAIIEKYALINDRALNKLRSIVRWADTDNMEKHSLTWALEAIASGAPLLCDSDHDALELEFPFYDSLYAYFKREIILTEFKPELEALQTRGEKRFFIRKMLDKV
ncbi:MAG: chromate resistance protein [Promethearchaeota archaeon]|nr:MAG: chromate resistance protein [Candidatus Lokiarchaeota archaeon]